MLSSQLSLQPRKQKKSRSQVGTVRWLRDPRGVAPGQDVENDENRVAGGISMVDLDAVIDVSPHARPGVSIS